MPDAAPAADPPAGLSYRQGVALVLVAGVCWSTMGLGIRAIEAANAWQILFFRSCAIVPFLFAVIAWRSKGRPFRVIRRAGAAGALGGLALVFAFSGGIYAVQATTVANAMFLFAAAPFLAAVLGLAVLGEWVRTGTWWAMAGAIAGMALMVWEGVNAGHLAGNVAALVSALGFACFTISLRWRKLDDMMPGVFLAGVFSLIFGAAVCQAAGFGFDVPAGDVGVALALGVGQVGLGLILYTIGSRAVPAAELALLSMTEVLLGPLWVWLAIGETAGLYTLLGGGVLLAAIAGNALSGLRRKPTPIL